MSAIVVKGRTWLCPDCDGYGAFGNGCHPHDPAYEDRDCLECDGTGVIRASYSSGWARNLQPWTGEHGRSASRVRVPHTDPLLVVAALRNGPRRLPGGGMTAQFGYGYPPALARAMCPTNKATDRWALADRYDARINPWRSAA